MYSPSDFQCGELWFKVEKAFYNVKGRITCESLTATKLKTCHKKQHGKTQTQPNTLQSVEVMLLGIINKQKGYQ